MMNSAKGVKYDKTLYLGIYFRYKCGKRKHLHNSTTSLNSTEIHAAAAS